MRTARGSIDSGSSVDRQSVVDRLSIDCQQTVIEMSADNRPSVGRLSVLLQEIEISCVLAGSIVRHSCERVAAVVTDNTGTIFGCLVSV